MLSKAWIGKNNISVTFGPLYDQIKYMGWKDQIKEIWNAIFSLYKRLNWKILFREGVCNNYLPFKVTTWYSKLPPYQDMGGNLGFQKRWTFLQIPVAFLPQMTVLRYQSRYFCYIFQNLVEPNEKYWFFMYFVSGQNVETNKNGNSSKTIHIKPYFFVGILFIFVTYVINCMN